MMMTSPFKHKSWRYDVVEDVISASMDMHLLADDNVISMVERYLHKPDNLLIVSTDVEDIKASRFSYYRSEEKKSGLFVSKTKIKEITKETRTHIRSATSRAKRINLSSSFSETLENVSTRNDLGEFDDLVNLTQHPVNRLPLTGESFSWQGYMSKIETDPENGFLLDAELSDEQPDDETALPTKVTVTSQNIPEETLWIETVNSQPVLVKIIYATVSIIKVDELFRKRRKKIHIIREDIDEGHRSETHFFPLNNHGV